MSKTWTKEEEQFIIDNYEKISREEFMAIFDVTKSSINHKIQRLGLPPLKIKGMNYPWKDEEIEYIKEHWIEMTDEEIWRNLGIDKLGFQKSVVQNKRNSLNLVGKSKIRSKQIRQEKTGYKYHINYDKRIYTHRENMEKYLGRELRGDEIVHHIDGNKSNDNIDNLWLCDNQSHQLLHHEIEEIAFQLFRLGYIKFDKDSGHYCLNMETRTEE